MLHDMINSVTYEKSASWLVGSCIIYSILLSNNINFISYIACNLLSLKTKYFINSYNYHPVLQFVRFGNWIKGSTYLLSNNFIANMMKMKKRHLVQYKNIKKTPLNFELIVLYIISRSKVFPHIAWIDLNICYWTNVKRIKQKF